MCYQLNGVPLPRGDISMNWWSWYSPTCFGIAACKFKVNLVSTYGMDIFVTNKAVVTAIKICCRGTITRVSRDLMHYEIQIYNYNSNQF